MSRQWPDKPPKRRSPMDSGNNSSGKGCCPMVAAVKSVKQGKFKLARRYAAMSVRLIAARAIRAVDWLPALTPHLLLFALAERPTF